MASKLNLATQLTHFVLVTQFKEKGNPTKKRSLKRHHRRRSYV